MILLWYDYTLNPDLPFVHQSYRMLVIRGIERRGAAVMWNEDDIVIGEDAAIEEAFDTRFEETDLIDTLELELGHVTVQIWSEVGVMH